MGIGSIANSISSVDREIASAEAQLQTINSNINKKEKEANAILEKIHREKDLKKIIGYNNDINKKNEEIGRLGKDKSSKSKTLADKQSKRLKLLQDLSKEEQRDREKAKREQKELLYIQQDITREMVRQKQLSSTSISFPSTYSEEVPKKYDVFVSHASEDKLSFVRPFVDFLR